MPLQFGIEPPSWLVDEIKWRRSFGDDATKMVDHALNIGSVLLQQKGQREALAMQADEQNRMHQDMEQLPVWLQQHDGDPNGYVPKSRWGQQTSAQAWQRKYQEGIVQARKTQADAMLEYRKGQAENQSVEGKERMKVIDQFNKDLQSIPTNGDTAGEKAAIFALPKGPTGLPSEEQFRRLGELQKKYPKIEKAQSPVGKLEADRTAAKNAGAPPEVIAAYDAAIAKQATKESKEPMTKTLPDGTTLAWMPGANTLHVLKGGKTVELTPSQAITISKAENLSPDDKSFFTEYAASKGKEMTKGFKPAEKTKDAPKASILDRIKQWFSGTQTGTQGETKTPSAAAVPASPPHDEAGDSALPSTGTGSDLSVDDFNKWLKQRQSQP